MRTTLDCLPCFLHQGLALARVIDPADERLHRGIVRAWAGWLAQADLEPPPPALAARLYALAGEISGREDPFQEIKREANTRLMELYPRLEKRVAEHEDPLLAALGFSIIGNYIDEGVKFDYDWQLALDQEGFDGLGNHDYKTFQAGLHQGANVFVIGDNAGEIVTDKLLVSRLLEKGCRVQYAVRGGAVINDATYADAREVGMTRMCRVLTTGTAAPGALLDECSAEFRQALDQADMVVSKGQGNFEALGGRYPGVFFAFKVKCEPVSRYLEVPMGRSVFMQW
jgi:uncharacterized protein with ATP-grasp and redox domains